ncbi:hypothetical protein RHMOL_Rhmol13G0018600 [Rhododendron molle]|uniref:Uncharacterized protein n=1 Tax=Rhododendron molle TaxID=49168 RepID=A0ACC0L1Z8_RHOML|nr:hypothetical protein RHMOL_Rhmol13G0018600 [Rhododendron molle]
MLFMLGKCVCQTPLLRPIVIWLNVIKNRQNNLLQGFPALHDLHKFVKAPS